MFELRWLSQKGERPKTSRSSSSIPPDHMSSVVLSAKLDRGNVSNGRKIPLVVKSKDRDNHSDPLAVFVSLLFKDVPLSMNGTYTCAHTPNQYPHLFLFFVKRFQKLQHDRAGLTSRFPLLSQNRRYTNPCMVISAVAKPNNASFKTKQFGPLGNSSWFLGTRYTYFAALP